MLFFSACGDSSSDRRIISRAGLEKGAFEFTSDFAELKVDFDRFLFVDVEVEGVAARFIIDTGADVFAVSRQFAELLALEARGKTLISTIVGVSEVDVVEISEFKLGNVRAESFDAAVVELSGFDGIVGLPFFESALVAIDFQSERLEIADPRVYALEDFISTGDERILSAPGFQLSGLGLNGIVLPALRLDTGSSGGIHLSRAQSGSFFEGVTEVVTTTFAASNGVLRGLGAIAETLSIADFVLRDQFVLVQEEELEFGLLGNLVLQQFTVVFDLSNGEVLLRRERDLSFELG